ncbi:hypothetical protein [Chitinophaga sp. MM2321]|uniref:hypothetical protein n=1 Tax=Chitinophaga sp. MM2321 TaxID=3137178 RepID=UPI0032D576B7
MTQDPLKSAWDSATTPSRELTALQAIVDKKSYPVLKDIKTQLTIESISYVVFLLVYYDFFDGDTKPLYANILLVASFSFMLLHNLAGYIVAKRPAAGSDLIQSLKVQLSRLKQYATVSVTSRGLGFAGMIAFFLINIRWTTGTYWTLAAVVLILGVQLFLLRRIWTRRIQKISNTVAELGNHGTA